MRVMSIVLIAFCLTFNINVFADENPAQLDTSVPSVEGAVVNNQNPVVKSDSQRTTQTDNGDKTKAAIITK